MQPETWELVTIVLGFIAACLAFGMCVFFARSKEGIGRAVALDKFAEGINMVVILVFAISYYFEWSRKCLFGWQVVCEFQQSPQLLFQVFIWLSRRSE